MYTQRPFSLFYYDDYWGLRNNPPPPPVTILRRPQITINFLSDLNNRAVPYRPPNNIFFSPPDSPPSIPYSQPSIPYSPPNIPYSPPNIPYSPPNSPPSNCNGFFNFTDCKEDELEKTVTSPIRIHHRKRKYFKKQ